MTEPYNVTTFGRDCMGNISGYMVDRYVWVPRPWSARSDGLCLEHEIAGKFPGDIYEPGSFERARVQAIVLASKLNPSVPHQSTD